MITLISGTNRPDSSTRKVTQHLENVYAQLDVPFQVVDLQHLPAEVFTPGVYAAKPASLQPMIDAVMQATGLVIVTPEYNGSFPGILKYYIDLLPHPKSFESRPMCFVGVAAGEWGALRSVEQLMMIAAYRNAYLYPKRVFIRGCGSAIDAEGKITDTDLIQRLQTQAEGFVDFTKKLKA